MKIKSYDNINWLRARKELLVNQEKLVEAYHSKNKLLNKLPIGEVLDNGFN